MHCLKSGAGIFARSKPRCMNHAPSQGTTMNSVIKKPKNFTAHRKMELVSGILNSPKAFGFEGFYLSLEPDRDWNATSISNPAAKANRNTSTKPNLAAWPLFSGHEHLLYLQQIVPQRFASGGHLACSSKRRRERFPCLLHQSNPRPG